MKICMITDAKHQQQIEEEKLDIACMGLDGLKAFNKSKKKIKKWQKQYQTLLVSDSLIKQIPRVLGPQLGKIGMFPQAISHNENIRSKITDIRSTVKFQLRKTPQLNVVVGNDNLTREELNQNIRMSLNFLASLTKDGWSNIKKVYLKTTMSRPIRII